MAKGDVMKDKWLVGVVVMALSIAVACMGETDPLTGGAPTTGGIVAGKKTNPGGSTGTTTGDDSPTGPISLSALDQCTATPQGVRSFTGIDDFKSALVGDWGLCGAPSVFGTRDAGLRISADGHWHKLVAGGAQTATVATGWGNEGAWDIMEISGAHEPVAYQLNLRIDGSGIVITAPQMAISPGMMRLNNEGVYIGNYIRLGSPSGSGGTPPSSTPSEGSISLAALSQCTTTPQGIRTFTNSGDIQSAIVGAWGRCDAPSASNSAMGILITGDGRWHTLVVGAGQTATVATGWGNEGSWEIIDPGISDSSGVFLFNLVFDGSGTILALPRLTTTPAMMLISGQFMFAGNFIRLTP